MGEENERLWSRPYVVLLLAIFGVSLVTSMFNLGMTYYADLINGGIELAGVSAGVFSLASMASKPLAAAVSVQSAKQSSAASTVFAILS